MLDDFFLNQKMACKFLINSVKNGRCSHAYLINTNDYSKGLDFAKAFAKYILCECNRTNLSNCNGCNKCKLIDENSYSDLKIISSDGLWIKKEQTDDLQISFSKKSINNGKMIYIIDGAHNLNISASNSILKFLEEPNDDIIAILLTNNMYKVLNTIVSRCQVINLNSCRVNSENVVVNVANVLYNNSQDIELFVNDSNSFDKIKKVIDFLVYIDSNKCSSIIYIDSIWNDFFVSKDDYLIAFNIMIMFYNDIINIKLGHQILLCGFELEISKFIDYDYSTINERLNLIMNLKNDLFSNVNLNLLMDKFIIRMGAI